MSDRGNTIVDSPSWPTLRWPVAVISLLIPFVFLPYIFDPFQFPKEILFHLGAVLILGVWVGGVFRVGAVRLARTGVTIPLILFLFIALLSVFQAPSKAEALSTVRDGAYALSIFVLVSSSLPGQNRLVPGSLGLAGLLTGGAGLLQILVGPRLSLLPSTMGGALVGDVSTAAVFVAALLPLLVGLAETPRGRLAWLWGLGAGVCLAFVVLARTRAGWLAALAGIATLLLLRVRRLPEGNPPWVPQAPRSISVHLTAGALALCAILWGIYGVGIRISSNPPSFKTSELQGWKLREDAWRITRGMLLAHPLGAGAGNWRYVFAAEAGNAPLRTGFSASRLPVQAGNEYLQVAAEMGPAGLLLLLWAGFGLIRAGWRRSGEGAGFPVDACTASLVGLSAACFLANPLREQPTLWAGTILAAVLCSGPRPAGSLPSPPFLEWEVEHGRRRVLGGLTAVLFLSLASLVLWRSGRTLLAGADLKYGQAACAAGDYARGLPSLLRAGRKDPTSLPARSRAASCALEAGRPDLSEREIRLALQLNPQDASSWLTLATALKQEGRLIDAIAACEKARSYWPREERINLFLGDLRKLTGDTLGAAEAYQAALGGNPSSVEAYLREGDVLLSRGQIVNAVMALAKAANMDPFSPEALSKLGAAYMRMGDYESAGQSYQSLMGVQPDDPAGMVGLAGAFSGLQRYCEAVPLLEKGKELLQKDPARAAALESAVREMKGRCERSRSAPHP